MNQQQKPKFSQLTVKVGQRIKGLPSKVGKFVWIPDHLDFETLTSVGQRPPTKIEKFGVELEYSYWDGRDEEISGVCDYNTARILHILNDAFGDYKKAVKQYLEYALPHYQFKVAIERLDLKNID